nr:hypothetical protein [uncultured Neisseria sp.]
MAKGCGKHGNGEVSDGIVHPPPSFPRRRESSLVGTKTYRKKQFLQPCVLDSRFCGNDGMLRRESRPLGSGNIQRLAEALEILDSRFHGNDGVSDGIIHPSRRHSRAGGNPERKI